MDAKLPQRLLLGLLILALMLFALTPIIWQFLTSVKTNAEIAAIPTVYWPTQWTLEHYQSLFNRRPIGAYLFNSSLIAIVSTLLSLGLGAPAAYGLARFRFQGQNLLLGAISMVILFPYIFLFLGLLELVKGLGLGNNYLALIIPYTAINLPLAILVLRSFFRQLPIEIEEAARLDGYRTMSLLWYIVLPLTLPALVTTGILSFIFAWNEYLLALTFMTRETMKTIPVATAAIAGSSIFEIPYGPMAAATVLATFPLVLLVLFFQRRIVQGLTAGAIKG
ncbi:carbohydrate ABC transporter permease [Synechocystis sp. LKSZ1]|uniref:carbohydrate ABC transporter permease n=1 Tax=Synechocystis sp. LKSZ1 TaxID=3144951 RepID=UPI00336C0CE5